MGDPWQQHSRRRPGPLWWPSPGYRDGTCGHVLAWMAVFGATL